MHRCQLLLLNCCCCRRRDFGCFGGPKPEWNSIKLHELSWVSPFRISGGSRFWISTAELLNCCCRIAELLLPNCCCWIAGAAEIGSSAPFLSHESVCKAYRDRRHPLLWNNDQDFDAGEVRNTQWIATPTNIWPLPPHLGQNLKHLPSSPENGPTKNKMQSTHADLLCVCCFSDFLYLYYSCYPCHAVCFHVWNHSTAFLQSTRTAYPEDLADRSRWEQVIGLDTFAVGQIRCVLPCVAQNLCSASRFWHWWLASCGQQIQATVQRGPWSKCKFRAQVEASRQSCKPGTGSTQDQKARTVSTSWINSAGLSLTDLTGCWPDSTLLSGSGRPSFQQLSLTKQQQDMNLHNRNFLTPPSGQSNRRFLPQFVHCVSLIAVLRKMDMPHVVAPTPTVDIIRKHLKKHDSGTTRLVGNQAHEFNEILQLGTHPSSCGDALPDRLMGKAPSHIQNWALNSSYWWSLLFFLNSCFSSFLGGPSRQFPIAERDISAARSTSWLCTIAAQLLAMLLPKRSPSTSLRFASELTIISTILKDSCQGKTSGRLPCCLQKVKMLKEGPLCQAQHSNSWLVSCVANCHCVYFIRHQPKMSIILFIYTYGSVLTHTKKDMYIYIYVCVYVCACVQRR